MKYNTAWRKEVETKKKRSWDEIFFFVITAEIVEKGVRKIKN